ncbi:MAG: hypothetical protein SV062_14095 [Thermodesulfobacteriota bacterium]|nr:hypothetical protein [Thermodesulfobacteriota bacterium]
MFKKYEKPKMRKLTSEEFGLHRQSYFISIPKPYSPVSGMEFILDIKPCMDYAKNLSIKINQNIILSHVLNKLMALAIAENPPYNQIILGNNLYQLEDVHIMNPIQIPDQGRAQQSIIIKNPHKKTLAEQKQEFTKKIFRLMKQKREPLSHPSLVIRKYIYKYGLNKLLSVKRIFSIGYAMDLFSNIILSVHEYNGPSDFKVLQMVQLPLFTLLMIHASRLDNHGDDNKQALRLSIFGDHRVIFGSDTYLFFESLKKIAAEPEKYF